MLGFKEFRSGMTKSDARTAIHRALLKINNQLPSDWDDLPTVKRPVLRKKGKEDPNWKNALARNTKFLAPKQKGKRLEAVVARTLRDIGHNVSSSPTSDYDYVIDRKKYEVKGSTTTAGSRDKYSFLQIRPSYDYDYLLLAAFSFDDTITMYRLTKRSVLKCIDDGIFKKQHLGKKGSSGTYSYNGPMDVFGKYWKRVKASG